MKFTDFAKKTYHSIINFFILLFKIIESVFYYLIKTVEIIGHILFIAYILIGNLIYFTVLSKHFIYDNQVYITSFCIFLSVVFLYSWFAFKKYFVFRKTVKMYVPLMFPLGFLYLFLSESRSQGERADATVFAWIIAFLPIFLFLINFLTAFSRKCPKCPFILSLNKEQVIEKEFLESRTDFAGYDKSSHQSYGYSFSLGRNIIKETIRETPRYRTVNTYRLTLECKRCGCQWERISEE